MAAINNLKHLITRCEFAAFCVTLYGAAILKCVLHTAVCGIFMTPGRLGFTGKAEYAEKNLVSITSVPLKVNCDAGEM